MGDDEGLEPELQKLVDMMGGFFTEMFEKLYLCYKDGRRGWDQPEGWLARMQIELFKTNPDPVDIANLAAFEWFQRKLRAQNKKGEADATG